MAAGTVKDPVLKVFGRTCVQGHLHILDLAAGHVIALQALEEGLELNNKVFAGTTETGKGSKGRFKAYNLGKGHGSWKE
ncbi:hypothetical protein EV368DRAFT_79641 [Lentinula lateritia]|uniref:Uncharacterized protein n=1 Tax=Lentinula aff. lateritia TaxID=2804960 RepID=A0ACC1TME7_9AGAR|nr:hypothetical protein F5876DRAFT_81510 [Lentinula aff. lateritia]KAJ3855425.1 hypothetical protein EV368DRAFT_79641 [Lentinula lateritia]KAJ3893561.1 hypothetical protein GG344DRAFT_74914 [Lentinula edodes]